MLGLRISNCTVSCTESVRIIGALVVATQDLLLKLDLEDLFCEWTVGSFPTLAQSNSEKKIVH